MVRWRGKLATLPQPGKFINSHPNVFSGVFRIQPSGVGIQISCLHKRLPSLPYRFYADLVCALAAVKAHWSACISEDGLRGGPLTATEETSATKLVTSCCELPAHTR